MAKIYNAPPFADRLIESLRSMGYSFETAISDIVDNSISAGAKHINVDLSGDIEPIISIWDDGSGMTRDELFSAMKYGSSNPNELRSEQDLGRFGLGLKSASLSQCKKLSVISKKNNQVSAFVWDLDVIVKQQAWALQELSIEEITTNTVFHEFLKTDHGTLVVWEHFDKLKNQSKDALVELEDYVISSQRHMSLIYHRFITEGLKIIVNHNLLNPIDPFLTSHSSTQILRSSKVYVDGVAINIQPYILPHLNKLTKEDLDKVGGVDYFRREQGFYIYRAKRLIIWGTWLRMTRSEEMTKLSRVKVDIPNSLDHLWEIDVKKSTAKIPSKIRKNLVEAVLRSTQEAKKVLKFRGRKVKNNKQTVWERIEDRDKIYYKINTTLPELEYIHSLLDQEASKILDRILCNLENEFPYYNVYLDYANHKSFDERTDENAKGLGIIEFIEATYTNNMDKLNQVDRFLRFDLGDQVEEILMNYKEGLEHA
jgi:hypothetical protein